MPIAIVFLVLGALDVQIRENRRTAAKVLIATFLLAFAAKQVAITVLWRSFTAPIDKVAATLNKLPAGAIIFTSECKPGDATVLGVYHSRQPAMEHLASIAAIDNARFAVGTFAIKGQQPIKVARAYASFERLQEEFAATCDLSEYSVRVGKIMAVQRSVASSGVSVPPVFLFLIRPPKGAVLPPKAKLKNKENDFSIYHILPAA
jgi:hypothetical protein